MNDPNPRVQPNEDEPDEPVRERLNTDATTNEPVSEEAIADADAIGTALREGR